MSPLQFAATSALLLACMHLCLGAPLPADNPVTLRTGTEALNSIAFADDYLQTRSACAHVDLPCPLSVSGCNTTASSISTNLNYLLYMYGYVLGLNQESNSTMESQLDKLDFLELVYLRFSNQMERYLQAYRRSCSDAMCITYQGVDKENIPGKVTALQQSGGYTHLELAKVVICHLRVMARNTVSLPEFENASLYGYRFCRSLPELQRIC